MKFNKWTLGLAAIGAVSLASAAKAEETANTVLTALSSTTISGYVDTSMQWNFGTGNANPVPVKFNAGKQDGFNLNVVQVSLAKPLDETEWAAGYRVDLWFGPDANTLGTQSSGVGSDFAVRQAYVALRTPVGNGLDWKIGVFDSIIGYESVAGPNNPNYTRSYGHSIEPQTHTGVLASYRINDNISVAAGIANTIGSAINGRSTGIGPTATQNESFKTYMASIAFTAPDTWGFFSGSTVYAGFVNGFNANNGEGNAARQLNFYAGATVATPIANLKLGSSIDYIEHRPSSVDDTGDGTAWAGALYASYQATEKLSLHLRGEYVYLANDVLEGGTETFDWDVSASHDQLVALTATAQYELWKNVLSRLEFRWDHIEHARAFGGTTTGVPTRDQAFMVAANVIYKF